jgi:hypothetical protein
MSLHLDVICDSELSSEDRSLQTVRAIAEILPFVLAKYGIGQQAGRWAAGHGGGTDSQGSI